MIHGELEHDAVDLVGAHPGPDFRHQHVEALRDQAAGLAHAGEGLRAVQLDLPGLAQRRGRRVDVIHYNPSKKLWPPAP